MSLHFCVLPHIRFAIVSSWLCLLLSYQFATAQSSDSLIVLEGQVVDAQSSGPLSYVNIGIANKNVGTVSAEDGQFRLILRPGQANDTLSFSFIGYETLRIPVEVMFALRIPVVMHRKAVKLQEIVVKNHRYKARFFGTFTQSAMAQAGFSENILGKECGVMMRTRRPTLLEEVQINFGQCSYDSVYFRLNVYQVMDKNTFEPLLSTPQYYAFSRAELVQTLALDIRSLNIQVQGDFLISVEYYRDLGSGNLYFKSALNKSTYIRATSIGNWKKVHIGISLGVFGQVEQ